MGVHTKPGWFERVARVISAPGASPDANPDATRSEPAGDAALRRGRAWPVAIIMLGLAATLAWALALGWAVWQALWGMLALMF